MTKKAILFDLDNTLYHYDPCNAIGLRAAHAILVRVVTQPLDDFLSLHEQVRKRLAKALFNQGASHNRVLYFKEMVETLIQRPHPKLVIAMHTAYWSAFLESMQPHPDADRVLETLGRNYRLAIVSNHTTLPQLEKIHRLRIGSYFAAIVTSEEAGVEKPDPGIFRLALERLGVTASEAVMLGDNLDGDILGARNAGIEAILTVEYATDYATGHPDVETSEHSIRHLADVLQRF